MSVDFHLPELGENIESGDVVNVLVREGDEIVGNQGVIELETDKAVVEIPCPHAGRVAKLHVNKGDTIKVGEPLLTVEGGDSAEPAAAEPAEVKAEQPSQKHVAPHKAPRPPEASKDQTDRAAPSKPEPARVPQPAPAAPPVPAPSAADDRLIPAGPAARRIARQLRVDLSRVQGTGTNGRITAEDVRNTAAQPVAAVPATAPTGPSPDAATPPGEPGQDKWGAIRVERMSKIRRTIAEQMSRSAGIIPHVTNFDEADVTQLEQLRKGVPEGLLGAEVKLTAMSFVMKAVAISLRRNPVLNASLDMDGGEITYKEYVHLGIAVDTPRGLVVPKVRNVDRMSIAEIARELVWVARKARAVQFTIDELRGGSFTISNLGAVGGVASTPIINHPEVAILLLGRTRWLPVVRDGQVVPRQVMPLSLSYDHRLVDGAAAARFLNDVIDLLGSPATLLLSQ